MGFDLTDIQTYITAFSPMVSDVVNLAIGLGILGFATALVFRLLGFGKGH